MGSAVLMFIGYKQTDRQAKFIYRFWKSANFFSEICEQNLISNKFSKSTKFFHEISELFYDFVLKCTQREHIHKLNRRLAQSALKTF